MDKIYALTVTSNNDEVYDDAVTNMNEFVGIFSSIEGAKKYIKNIIIKERDIYQKGIEEPIEFISDYKEGFNDDGTYKITFTFEWRDSYELRNFIYEIKETEVDALINRR